jgi:hypothetical protein
MLVQKGNVTRRHVNTAVSTVRVANMCLHNHDERTSQRDKP